MKDLQNDTLIYNILRYQYIFFLIRTPKTSKNTHFHFKAVLALEFLKKFIINIKFNSQKLLEKVVLTFIEPIHLNIKGQLISGI